MNNLLKSLNDSIKTSISIGLFKNYEKAFEYHVTKSKKNKLKIMKFKKGEVENFNPERLSGNKIIDAFPPTNRPRGQADIDSVKYHMKQIKLKKEQHIWIVKKKNKIILLDGAHRIVAYHLLGKEKIPAYIISMT